MELNKSGVFACAFCILFLIGIMSSCEKETIALRNNFTGIFTGEVYYFEQSANPLTGYVEYDSTYQEIIVVQPQGEDSVRITSFTFGTRIIPFLEEEEYLITYGSHAAFTCRFAAGGDSVYLHSYTYSGTGASNYYQLDLDFAGGQQ